MSRLKAQLVGRKRADRSANQQKKAESIRDEWIKVMQLRLVRDELQKCYRAEGENHYHVCAPIVKVYDDLLKEARVRTEKSACTNLR